MCPVCSTPAATESEGEEGQNHVLCHAQLVLHKYQAFI